MIPNKDLCIDSENGKIVLNGDKYDLGTQGEIDTAVKDVYSVMGQNGAKNLIPYPYNDTTKTVGTLTFTDNGDGSITVNGTATQNSTFYFTPSTWNNEEIKGNVIFSSGGAALNSNFKITVESPSGTNKNLENNGELSLAITAAIKNIRLFVANGTIVNNVTVKPMLRLASDTDNTYEPYAMTNKQLTEQVADVKGTIGDITQTGFTGSTVAAQLGNIKSREGMKILSTSAHPINVSFTNGVGTINLFDIDSKAMEIVSLFCWGLNANLSFSLSNWATKSFTINNLTSPTYTGTLAIEVIYSVYNEV